MTDNDPFTNPPPANPPASATPPAATPPPPGVLQPGMLSPDAAPAPPPPPPGAPGAAFPTIVVPPAPTGGLARSTILLTGVYAGVGLIMAFLTPGIVERLKTALADPTNATTDVTYSLLGFVSFAVGVAAYVVLALWMSRVRTNRTQAGEAPGGPPAVEWWGWFVPLANFVLPFLGMRAITRRLVGVGVLLGWWIPWCLVWPIGFVSGSTQFTAIDLTTGELTNPEALDQMVPLAWASGVLTAISWLFLVMIIRTTTKRQGETLA